MWANHKTAASLKTDMMLSQKNVTQLLWSHFFQKHGKNAQNLP